MKIIPVIHMQSHEQVRENIQTIRECGINQAFLINHTVSDMRMVQEAAFTKLCLKDFWIGVNCLGLSTNEALKIPLPVWCDQTPTEHDYKNKKCDHVFGGLAFKYQPQPSDLKAACEQIKLCCDVATTSGDGTGIPASRHKIQLIRQYLGDFPLAVASGVSSENIKDYIGLVDYVLVASSITDENEIIVKEKLLELMEKSCQS